MLLPQPARAEQFALSPRAATRYILRWCECVLCVRVFRRNNSREESRGELTDSGGIGECRFKVDIYSREEREDREVSLKF